MSFRIKKGRRIDDSRLDDWLITYADMITLILCFFAVLLSVSVVKKENLEQAKQVVAEHFAAPVVAKGTVASPSKTGQSLDTIIQDKQGMVIKQGDRYTNIEMNSAPFFASGSAELAPDGQRLLATLIPVLKSNNFMDYMITVEGHTDDMPIGTGQFPSNWELSTARAAAVVRYLINNGIPAAKLRAVGYAQVMPKVPNRDETDRPIPENQAQNRRVVIKLEKIE